MPTKRRVSKSGDAARGPWFQPWADQQLLEGYFPTSMLSVGYGTLVASQPHVLEDAPADEREFILTAMREDWERKRDRLMVRWTADPANEGKLPWAAEQFDNPEQAKD